MRVGVYLNGVPPEEGGAYTFENEVLNALVSASVATSHNFVFFIVGGRIPEAIRKQQHKAAVRFIHVKPPGIWQRVWSALKVLSPVMRRVVRGPSRLERIFRRSGVEFVWFVSGGAYEPIDIPYIATVWDIQHQLQPWFPEVGNRGTWEMREVVHRPFLQRASFILTGTHEGCRQVQQYYAIGSDRFRVVPLPVPQFAPHDKDRQRSGEVLALYGLTRGQYILYPAQFWAHKNHANLLYALAELREKHGLEIPVVFAGSDKGNLSHVKTLVHQLTLDGLVHFVGFVPRDTLTALYENALALVMPTFFGPDNLPPLEAFALGCPVIMSGVPGAREQLGDAALFFEPTNPSEIAAEIARVHSSIEVRTKLVARGRERAAKWTAIDYVKRVINTIDDFERVRRCWAY